jgi:hypothetical protein
MNCGESVDMNIRSSDQLLCAQGRFFKRLRRGDHFGWVATAIVTSIVICVSAWPAHASLDFSLGAEARSYPLSGVIESELGYGALLWGQTSTPFYGYLRPRILASTAATYNSADAALEIFPLSFLGFRAGGESIQNDQNYSAYDCDTYRCKGRFYRAYAEAELTLGMGPVFVQGRWRRERWSEPHAQTGDYIDPTSGLAMASSGESQVVYFGIVGMKLAPEWTALAMLRYAQEDSGGISRMPVGAIRFHRGIFSISVGAGNFESILKKSETTVIGSIKFELAPSLALR